MLMLFVQFRQRRRIAAIAATAIGLGLLQGSIALAEAPTPNQLAPSPISQLGPVPGFDITGAGPASAIHGDPVAGAAKFAATCSSCHGDRGTQGVSNPGSTDGTVPVLKPIDPGLLEDSNGNASIFAQDLDRFVQHGSRPAGPHPLISMPAFGDHNQLSQSDIADIEAYVMQLNGTFWPDRCPGMRLELANPAANSLIRPGTYVAQGRALDVRATQGSGVNRVDFFLDARDAGGRFVGTTGSGPLPAGGGFRAALSMPKVTGAHNLFAYASSAVMSGESVVSVPIALGQDPSKAFAGMPAPSVPPAEPANCTI